MANFEILLETLVKGLDSVKDNYKFSGKLSASSICIDCIMTSSDTFSLYISQSCLSCYLKKAWVNSKALWKTSVAKVLQFRGKCFWGIPIAADELLVVFREVNDLLYLYRAEIADILWEFPTYLHFTIAKATSLWLLNLLDQGNTLVQYQNKHRKELYLSKKFNCLLLSCTYIDTVQHRAFQLWSG